MTTREEIREQARKNYPNTKTHPMESASFCGFTAGGAYGYNLAIERVCEYLESIDFEQRYLDSENLFDKETFINDLKQAMKL